MAGTQELGDILAGAAGAPVNRPALNTFVATSQARNGLVTEQTQNAMLAAQKSVEEAQAQQQVGNYLQGIGLKPSEAMAAQDLYQAQGGGNFNQVVEAIQGIQKYGFSSVLGDPNSTPVQQTAAQQGIQGKVAAPVAVPNEYIMPPGSGLAQQPIQQSPMGQALTGKDVADAEEAHQRATTASQAATYTMTPDAVTNAAYVVMADPTKMNEYAGFGQSGQNNKNQINNTIAQMLNAAGMTPSDMIRQRAIAKASIGSAAQAAKQAQTLDAFTPLVQANGARITQLLSGIDANGANMPLIAGLERATGRQLGSADLAELHSVFGTYQQEVARLLASGPSMNGVISDKSRNDVQSMAPENMTTAQALRVISRINTELRIRRAGVQNAMDAATGAQLPVTALGGPGGGAAPAVTGAPGVVPGSTAAAPPPAPTNLAAMAAAELQRRGIVAPGAAQ